MLSHQKILSVSETTIEVTDSPTKSASSDSISKVSLLIEYLMLSKLTVSLLYIIPDEPATVQNRTTVSQIDRSIMISPISMRLHSSCNRFFPWHWYWVLITPLTLRYMEIHLNHHINNCSVNNRVSRRLHNKSFFF